MKQSVVTGISFGLTSGAITTLGLMVGLHSGTHSKVVVVGGILTIAIADAFSDALGIHMSEEAENHHTIKQIWISTVSTFFSKLIFALTFVFPVIFFELGTAVVISVIWGLSILALLSYKISKSQAGNPLTVIAEHLAIAVAVIIITHFIGNWISAYFR